MYSQTLIQTIYIIKQKQNDSTWKRLKDFD